MKSLQFKLNEFHLKHTQFSIRNLNADVFTNKNQQKKTVLLKSEEQNQTTNNIHREIKQN